MQSPFYRIEEENSTDIVAYLQPFSNNQSYYDWGPKRDPLYIVVPISVAYVAIFLTGILGNISTCIVIARNKCMHTATNYYLFSLAISDLLLLVSGLPQEMYFIWSKYPYVFGEIFCVLQGFTAETSANATVLTITAFTVERYVAICHPFLSHTLSKLNRAIKYIIFIWAIAMCLAVPQAMALGVVCEKLNGYVLKDYCVCNVKHQIIPHAFEISFFVFFVGPMSLITLLYIFIGLQLRKSTVGSSRSNSINLKRHRICEPVVAYVHSSAQILVTNRSSEPVPENGTQVEEKGRKNFARSAQATKHVVKMLVAVVVAFFICWAPFHAQRLLAIYGRSERTSANMIKAFQILTYLSGIFYYLSTTVNPLLYHIMSNKFREAFKMTYQNICKKNQKLPRNRCYSTLSAPHHSNSDSYTGVCWGGTKFENLKLNDHQRPLVVSFKRQSKRAPQHHEFTNVETVLTTTPRRSKASPVSTSRVIRKGHSSSSLSKLKNSYSFSSPLIKKRRTLERSRSFAKELQFSNTDFQEILENLYHNNCSNNRFDSKEDCQFGIRKETTEMNECNFVSVHMLRPKHICP